MLLLVAAAVVGGCGEDRTEMSVVLEVLGIWQSGV